MSNKKQAEKIIEIIDSFVLSNSIGTMKGGSVKTEDLADQILQALQPEIELDKITGTIHEKEEED